MRLSVKRNIKTKIYDAYDNISDLEIIMHRQKTAKNGCNKQNEFELRQAAAC